MKKHAAIVEVPASKVDPVQHYASKHTPLAQPCTLSGGGKNNTCQSEVQHMYASCVYLPNTRAINPQIIYS